METGNIETYLLFKELENEKNQASYYYKDEKKQAVQDPQL